MSNSLEAEQTMMREANEVGSEIISIGEVNIMNELYKQEILELTNLLRYKEEFIVSYE